MRAGKSCGGAIPIWHISGIQASPIPARSRSRNKTEEDGQLPSSRHSNDRLKLPSPRPHARADSQHSHQTKSAPNRRGSWNRRYGAAAFIARGVRQLANAYKTGPVVEGHLGELLARVGHDRIGAVIHRGPQAVELEDFGAAVFVEGGGVEIDAPERDPVEGDGRGVMGGIEGE